MSAAGLSLGAIIVAFIELDATCAGQFMISRPIVLGPALGLAFGEAELGALFGTVLELLSLGELPIGGNLPVNATVAAGVAILLALTPVPAELALPTGILTGWGHKRLELRLRRSRSRLCRGVEQSLSRGSEPSFGALAARELVKQALLTLGVVAAGLLAGRRIHAAWPLAPEALKAGLRLGWEASAWIGTAALLHCFLGVLRWPK